MVRDTNRDVKQILLNQTEHKTELEGLQSRIANLEKWQTRVITATSMVTTTLLFIIAHLWK